MQFKNAYNVFQGLYYVLFLDAIARRVVSSCKLMEEKSYLGNDMLTDVLELTVLYCDVDKKTLP